jgi:hypothetical protein
MKNDCAMSGFVGFAGMVICGILITIIFTFMIYGSGATPLGFDSWKSEVGYPDTNNTYDVSIYKNEELVYRNWKLESEELITILSYYKSKYGMDDVQDRGTRRYSMSSQTVSEYVTSRFGANLTPHKTYNLTKYSPVVTRMTPVPTPSPTPTFNPDAWIASQRGENKL